MNVENLTRGFSSEAGDNATHGGTTEKDDAALYGETLARIGLQRRVIYSYIHFSTGILIIVTNLFLLICFKKFYFLKRKQNIYIFTLCVSDFMAGLAAILVSCLNGLIQYHNIHTKNVCIFSAVFQYFTLVTSLYSMLCAALERYIHIAHPFLHARHSESRVHVAIVLIGWFILVVCSVLLGYPNIAQQGTFCYLPDISHPRIYPIIFPLTTIPQILAIAVVMLLILKLIKKHSIAIAAIEQLEQRLTLSAAAISKYEGNASGTGPSTSQGLSNPVDNNVIIHCQEAVPKVTGRADCTPAANSLRPINHAENTKIANNPLVELPAFKELNRSRTNMVIVLLIASLICWVPVILTIILKATLRADITDTVEWVTYGEFSVFMVTLNSLLNPILYQRFSPDIKKAYRILLRGIS